MKSGSILTTGAKHINLKGIQIQIECHKIWFNITFLDNFFVKMVYEKIRLLYKNYIKMTKDEQIYLVIGPPLFAQSPMAPTFEIFLYPMSTKVFPVNAA